MYESMNEEDITIEWIVNKYMGEVSGLIHKDRINRKNPDELMPSEEISEIGNNLINELNNLRTKGE